ncbi:putative Ser/Thr protein phosphatase [Encephalitozoon intestinalis ATCC 50506]|uniref:Ser/Thr protein phosphatase n=1 Tax=Encephalitozoon intestinalis (strain ATCC 50506) TaxID=876142 RepID=E0S874_ENCIT|nr:putative Ser/Thr protein phosphatase [Encephalitozoon intestinalis ATCC 50506]ADM11909.1 putative Ser/Thr protein phosphatase [Encephalitozoon intestinalis ATCC 50506]
MAIKSKKGYSCDIPMKSINSPRKNTLHARLNPRFSFRIASRVIHRIVDPKKLKKTEYMTILDFLRLLREKTSNAKNPKWKRILLMFVISKSSVKIFLSKEIPTEAASIQVIGIIDMLIVNATKKHRMQNNSLLRKIFPRKLPIAPRTPPYSELIPRSLSCTLESEAIMHNPTIIDKQKFL